MKWAISVALGIAALISAGRCEANRVRARQLYDQAVKQYNLGDFQPALESFRAAYTEFSEPSILFNLGQCERQLGNKAKAVTLYRSYLRELPDAPNAADVRRIVSSLEEDLQHEQAAKAPATVEPAVPSPEKAVPAPSSPNPTSATAAGRPAPLVIASHSEPSKPRRSKAWVWGVVAGVVAVGVGVGLGVGLGVPNDRYPSATAGTGVLR